MVGRAHRARRCPSHKRFRAVPGGCVSIGRCDDRGRCLELPPVGYVNMDDVACRSTCCTHARLRLYVPTGDACIPSPALCAAFCCVLFA